MFLLERIIDSGAASEWTYFFLAAFRMGIADDREAVLPLLREAARRGGEAVYREFLRYPEFAAVRDDPEFLSAVAARR